MGKKEHWREIPDREAYEASSLGRIRRKPALQNWWARHEARKPTLTWLGYLQVRLGRAQKTESVHGLVARTFLGPRPPGKLHINHKDGCKTNNCPGNLEYVTISENQLHAYATGLRARFTGESNPNAKLSNDRRQLLVQLAGLNEWPAKELGEAFGVTPEYVLILNRRARKESGC